MWLHEIEKLTTEQYLLELYYELEHQITQLRLTIQDRVDPELILLTAINHNAKYHFAKCLRDSFNIPLKEALVHAARAFDMKD